MSKLNDYFNNLTASDDLKQKTLNSILDSQQTKDNVASDFPITNSNINSSDNTTTFNINSNKPKQKNKRRILAPVLAVASIFFVILLMPVISIIARHVQNSSPSIDFNNARQVQSERQLRDLLATNEFRPTRTGGLLSCNIGCATADWDGGWLHGGVAPDNAAPPPAAPDADRGATPNRPQGTSGTSEVNVQVESMDEGDIVRNNGNYIFRLSPAGLTIVSTSYGYVTHIATMQYTNFAPVEMFVRNNQLIVIGGAFNNRPHSSNWDFNRAAFNDFFSFHTRTQIRVYCIIDTDNPALQNFFEIDGNFNTARICTESNALIFVVQYFTRMHCIDTSNRPVRRPYFRVCDTVDAVPLSLDYIYYFRHNATRSYMILGRIDLNDLNQTPLIRAYLSNSKIISVSRNNLFISTTQAFFDWRGDRSSVYSHIARFCLTTLNATGAARVPGIPPSRHAIDEYRGYLRVATTYGNRPVVDWNGNPMVENTLASAVTVFDQNLNQVSQIRDIGRYEMMDSATFYGNFGYISTSPPDVIIDPLYTIDLTDPHNPILSEGLEIDGVNQLLRAIPGTGLAIGIGQDAPPEGSEVQTGVKIELFNMFPGTGKMPESLAKYTIFGSNTNAEVLWNSRALLFMFCPYTLQGVVGFSAESSCMMIINDFTTQSSFNSPQPVTFNQGFFLFAIDGINNTLTFLSSKNHSYVYCRQQNIYVTLLAPTFSNFYHNMLIFPLGNQDNDDWQARWDLSLQILDSFINRAIINNGYLYTISNTVIAGYCMVTLNRISQFSSVY